MCNIISTSLIFLKMFNHRAKVSNLSPPSLLPRRHKNSRGLRQSFTFLKKSSRIWTLLFTITNNNLIFLIKLVISSGYVWVFFLNKRSQNYCKVDLIFLIKPHVLHVYLFTYQWVSIVGDVPFSSLFCNSRNKPTLLILLLRY